MSFGLRSFVLFLVCAVAVGGVRAVGQAIDTADQRIAPSVFVGGTGVWTGLTRGRNVSLTAGLDIAFLPTSAVQPAFEYRGTYAVDKGGVDSLKNNLVGLNVSRHIAAFHPYGDLLVGRGETTYANGGYQVPGKNVFYVQSSSNVFSLGGGTDVYATPNLALKVDLQLQRYSSPVTVSGHLYTESATIGVVYAFHLPHIF